MRVATIAIALTLPLAFRRTVLSYRAFPVRRYSLCEQAAKRRRNVAMPVYNQPRTVRLSVIANARIWESQEAVKEVLLSWVRKWVISQGLCPWAAGVMTGNKLHIAVINNTNTDNNIDIYDQILNEAYNVIDPAKPTETTLIAIPAQTNFLEFLDLVSDVEDLLEQNKLSSEIQLAHFHPDYQFADSDEDDVTNYTNRSPFAVLHLLRVPQVTEAIDRVHGDTDFVWINNKKRLNNLGIKRVKSIQSEIIQAALSNKHIKTE